jgi:hypothetical protein
MVTASYVIVVDGEVDPACAIAFAPADVTVGDGRTTVHTEAIDQPGLHGILDRVANLGLTLLSVTTTETAVDTASARRSARRT